MNSSNKILSLYLRSIVSDVTVSSGVVIPLDVICIREYCSECFIVRHYLSSCIYREIIASDSIRFTDIVS